MVQRAWYLVIGFDGRQERQLQRWQEDLARQGWLHATAMPPHIPLAFFSEAPPARHFLDAKSLPWPPTHLDSPQLDGEALGVMVSPPPPIAALIAKFPQETRLEAWWPLAPRVQICLPASRWGLTPPRLTATDPPPIGTIRSVWLRLYRLDWLATGLSWSLVREHRVAKQANDLGRPSAFDP